MELEDALFAWVSTQPTLTAWIGAPPLAVRLFKGKIPQAAKLPCIVQQRSNTGREALFCKVDGAVRISQQLDVYGKDWASMAALSKAIRVALRPDVIAYPFYMVTGDSPAVSLKVKAATLENEFDSDDPEPGLSRRTQLWTFWVWEP